MRKEDPKEVRISQLIRMWHFPTSDVQTSVLNLIMGTCVTLMNIFLWSRLGGYIFGPDLEACCFHYLTRSSLSWCWLWERKNVETISEPENSTEREYIPSFS